MRVLPPLKSKAAIAQVHMSFDIGFGYRFGATGFFGGKLFDLPV
ncbi:hypothetical protein [Roseovarius sp. PS-C2]|nr:hypothetical protein [Roseovarius sp. PS-C2]